MREITNTQLKAHLAVDDGERVRQINHLEEPWTSSQESPLLAAIDYLHQMSGVLEVPNTELQNPHQQVSFVEPMAQGVEYRLGEQKQLFDSTTIIFNQTYLNVPVWRAGITLTLKHNPNRVVMAVDTSQQGMHASLPSPERIEEHRRLFALAAADQQVRALGLE